MPGRITLVATPIGNLADLSPRATSALADADLICCEDTRHTRKLLTAAGISGIELLALHAHNEASVAPKVVARAAAGAAVAVVTDAGLPGISDPGERLVRAAAEAGVEVAVVPGPSAGVAALVVSGLPTNRWCFEGFLPRQGGARRDRLRELAGETRTTVLYEAPHHLVKTLEDLQAVVGADRPIALVRELTKVHEEVWRGDVAGALERARDGEQRGEWVVVLGGGRPVEVTDDQIATAIDRRIEGGDSVKAAVATVTSDLGVARRRVYAIALARKPAPPGSDPGIGPGKGPGDGPATP